jgi:hypothetical protein
MRDQLEERRERKRKEERKAEIDRIIRDGEREGC